MLQPPPGAPAPPIGPALCLGKPVVPVIGTAVTLQLPTDCAAVAAQSTGNGRGTKAFLSQGTYRYSFVQGDLVVPHGCFSILAGTEKLQYSRSPPDSGSGRVALSL